MYYCNVSHALSLTGSILRAVPPERNGGTCFTLMKLLISEVLQQENGSGKLLIFRCK